MIKVAKFLTAVVMMILSSSFLNAQTNFSGNWVYDKTKSAERPTASSDYPGTVTRHISQDANSLRYSETYAQTGQDDYTSGEEVFLLDGKEQSVKSESSEIKKSARWSPDKKGLALTYIMVRGGTSYLSTENLKLSDDGRTLTIEMFNKNPVEGEYTVKKVYNKK